ncbi:MAG: rhodanese-like domain-containing protein [Acidobacteriota bacterium]
MKKLFIEISVILIISVSTSLIFNFSSGSPLPVFKKYVPNEDKPIIFPEIDTISLEVLEFLMTKERSLLLDARPYESYRDGHIPGSFSFPVNEFEKIFPERGSFLKLAKTIIVYCSSKDCKDSADLALYLLDKGFGDIFIYEGGIEEWISKGKDIEQSKN